MKWMDAEQASGDMTEQEAEEARAGLEEIAEDLTKQAEQLQEETQYIEEEA